MDLTWRWKEASSWVFAIDSELDGMPARRGVGVIDGSTLCNPELFPNEVDTGDLFGHWVFHLQACVDLEERNRSISTNQKLAGASANVARFFQNGLRRFIEQSFLSAREKRGRCLFDEFLMPALQGTIAR